MARAAPSGEPCRKSEGNDGTDVIALGFAHSGDAALELGHACITKRLRYGELFRTAEGHARRLFAVTQRTVDDPHP